MGFQSKAKSAVKRMKCAGGEGVSKILRRFIGGIPPFSKGWRNLQTRDTSLHAATREPLTKELQGRRRKKTKSTQPDKTIQIRILRNGTRVDGKRKDKELNPDWKFIKDSATGKKVMWKKNERRVKKMGLSNTFS